MDTAVKTTPLHAWHVGKNANMAAFGGYEMPLWYPSGAKAEHLAAITSAVTAMPSAACQGGWASPLWRSRSQSHSRARP